METLLHWENINKDSKIDLRLWDYLNPSANSVMEDWLGISKETSHNNKKINVAKSFCYPPEKMWGSEHRGDLQRTYDD